MARGLFRHPPQPQQQVKSVVPTLIVSNTNNGLGQAQADIKAVNQQYGQAQADIKAKGNAFGQAQADIEAIGRGFGQAQATIAIRGNVFAQAQALIYIPQYIPPVADVSNDGWVGVVV